MTIGSHMQIMGEVKNILAEESILNDSGRISLSLLDPLIYNEEEDLYHHVGAETADAFKSGILLRDALKQK